MNAPSTAVSGAQMPGAAAPIRILLVDDHRSMLWGLERLIASEPARMQVVGRATNKAEIFAALAQPGIDLVLLDIDLGGESSLDFMDEIQRATPARILILTGLRDEQVHQRAVLAGARGVVLKDVPAEVILQAIERVHAGEVWLDRGSIARLLDGVARGRMPQAEEQGERGLVSLTRKERDILAALAANPGAPNKTLASKLFISEHTLRNHLTSIFDKLGVKNRFELTMYALERKAQLGPQDRGPH